MPTYQYRCFDCGEEMEATQRISEDPLKVCPKCNSTNFKRLISATAFVLKGSGWYKTDYASGNGTSSGSSHSSSPASDSTSSSASTSTESASTSEAKPAEKPAAEKPAVSKPKSE